MNRQTFGREEHLKIGFFLNRGLERLALREARVVMHHAVDVMKIGFVIRGDVERAASLEGSVDQRQKGRLYESAAVMFSLGPGIGKEEVKGANGIPGKQVFQDVVGVRVEQADVGQPGSFRPGPDFLQAADLKVRANQVDVRMGNGMREKKSPLATAKIHLHGGGPPEQGGEIERGGEAVGSEDHRPAYPRKKCMRRAKKPEPTASMDASM